MDQSTTTAACRLPPRGAVTRLVVTGHFIRAGRVGGAEPMLYNLMHGLCGTGVATTLLCGRLGDLSPAFLDRGNEGSLTITECGGAGNRFVAEQRACLDWGGSSDAVLFPNYYVPPLVPRRLGCVGVVMHDFQYRHYPQYFSARKRVWLRASQRQAVQRADRVIAISNFVADDAVRLFGRKVSAKLRVVPNPLSWQRFDGGMDRPRPMPDRYILSVAAQYPHKNLATAIRAFAIVAAADRDVQLVLCGQSYDGLRGVAAGQSGIGGLIAELGLADRVRLTGYVDDATLAQWYRHAALFVFPSLFEGFGMPPVEALGFGLPTLTTATTALPEVTRGLARTVRKPLDAAEWADAMLDMLRNPERHAPAPAETAALRAFYQPERIAAAYLAALAG